MKQMTEKEILSNWQKFIAIVDKEFSGDRKDKIVKMVDFFQDRMILAPASSKEHYHSSYPGGYIQHVLNVYNISISLSSVWDLFSKYKDYNNEEISLVALFHDIGKLGDEQNEFYQPQDNDWRRNNLGEIYKINSNLINMNGADRSLYLLQKFGILLTQNEWISIKIHEGLYEDGNEQYLKTSFDSSIIKSHLPHLIHHADVMATRIEYEEWKNEYSTEKIDNAKNKKYTTKDSKQKVIADAINNSNKKEFSFDDLFEDDTHKEK